MHETLILVDEQDVVRGTGEKIEIHLTGALHRAFSVFIFNSQGELLLQKRSMLKYHSKGLWSNTCCGHPRHNESTEKAAHRRLMEEMGLDCSLEEVFQFTYRTILEEGLIEHEFNHVFVSTADQDPAITVAEADDWRWIDLQLLQKEIDEDPLRFTYWFRLALNILMRKFEQGLPRIHRFDQETFLQFPHD